MPVIRLLIPFLLGIVQQCYWPVPVSVLQGLAMISTSPILLFIFLPLPFSSRYKLGFINGLSVFSLFAVLGSLSVWQQDIRLTSLWPGNIYKETDALVIKLQESPAEKSKSLKANGKIYGILRNDSLIRTNGTLILYFNKDSVSHTLTAGDLLLTRAALQPIPRSANPGGFDFHRYAAFQGISHQLFLRQADYRPAGHQPSFIQQLITNSRTWVLAILKRAFPDKKERGLAEALLIGYKDELDKTLVQSYTNTGVVHIIAISGLHLGLIYWLLVKLFQPMQKSRQLKWLRPLLIITALWIFALLVGAQPSVLRSALMFTCIVAGETLSRKPNIYNSLALSAFLLLCYNPYWLWDAGFQLSYAAIIGIVAFMKPIYHLFTIRNKLLDLVWQLNAVTLAAQLITLPVCLYHFHQFPVYFLLSNFIAVPVSSLILFAEILICCTSFIPMATLFTGKITAWLIRFMNTYIERMESLPFAVWNGLQISFIQAVLLTVFLVLACVFFFKKERTRLILYSSVAALSVFLLLRCASFITANRQRMIIVYQQSAELIAGRSYQSISSTFASAGFYTAPTHLFYRLRQQPVPVIRSENYISFFSRKILLLNDNTLYSAGRSRPLIDLLILSQNPAAEPASILRAMNIRQVVADATIPLSKTRRWQQLCDSLQVPFHDVRTKGAFVMNL